jgi:acetyl-CoA carboxylase carboxyltransferase component
MEIIKTNSAKNSNIKIDKRKLNKEKKDLIVLAEEKASVWHTSSELMDDGIIDPRNTRFYLSFCLDIINKEKIKGSSSYGTFRL